MRDKAQARRQFVLLHDPELGRIGEHPRRTDWVTVGTWTVIGLVSGSVMAGGVFAIWLGTQVVWRWLGG